MMLCDSDAYPCVCPVRLHYVTAVVLQTNVSPPAQHIASDRLSDCPLIWIRIVHCIGSINRSCIRALKLSESGVVCPARLACNNGSSPGHIVQVDGHIVGAVQGPNMWQRRLHMWWHGNNCTVVELAVCQPARTMLFHNY